MIVLTTLNASYIHASLGLRYLFANLGDLQADATLHEFTINQPALEIAEQLLLQKPDIIGFGVYIWNLQETLDVMRLVKAISPSTQLIVGGPEATYSDGLDDIGRLADHLLTGPADQSFYATCKALLSEQKPPSRISSPTVDLQSLADPYDFYTEEDIAHRVIYVEASRGCPFKCEFCLSSLDKTAVPFDIERFLQSMQRLLDRGARSFKFVDRTFNLKIDTSRRILEFFLAQIDKGLFLHFELIPDRLPEKLKELLVLFPPNSLQFEIGIQSFNPDVQQRISRKQHHERTCENLRWLRQHTHAYIHADLIFGLPGESLSSFADGFDLLHALGPQEIQVGLLKYLKGTPIARHSEPFAMKYMSKPPYRVLSTLDADFATVQRVDRFSRYWDMLANSGRFPSTLPLILSGQPFERFFMLADWLFEKTHRTHGIALQKLFPLLAEAMQNLYEEEPQDIERCLQLDYQHNQLKGSRVFIKPLAAIINAPVIVSARNKRQVRH